MALERTRLGPAVVTDGIEARVQAALDGVTDPCSQAAGAPAGLVEMGLVRELVIASGDGGAHVVVTLTLTDPGCLLGSEFARAAQEAVAAVPGVALAEVCVDHRVDWDPSRMTPAYRARLEAVRERRRSRLPLR